MRKVSLVPAAAVGALLLAATSACGGSGSGSGDGVTSMNVVLPHGTIFTLGLPFAVAQQKGFFARNGVDPKPVTTQGGGTSVRTVISGSADLGVETGPASVMSAYANNAPVKIVAASTTGDDILTFTKASSPYRSVDDLSGKKVGFSERGSSSDLHVAAINQILAAHQRPPADGQSVGSPPDALTAVQTGQIAAGWTIPPTFLDQVNSGKLRIVVNGFKDVPSLKQTTARVMFTSNSYLAEDRAAVRGFVKAWQQAWTWSFRHRDKAVRIWQQKDHLRQPAKVLKLAFDYYTRSMLNAKPIRGLDTISRRAAAANLLKAPLSAEQLRELVDTSPAAQG